MCLTYHLSHIRTLVFATSCLVFLRLKENFYSKKYGVENINYTPAGATVMHSSNKVDGKGINLFNTADK